MVSHDDGAIRPYCLPMAQQAQVCPLRLLMHILFTDIVLAIKEEMTRHLSTATTSPYGPHVLTDERCMPAHVPTDPKLHLDVWEALSLDFRAFS